jgi:hypothetical protein
MAKAIRDIDRGYGRILKALVEFKGQEIAVGLQAGDKTDDGKFDIASVGVVQEFGSDNIPERPFLRNSFDEKNKAWNSVALSQVGQVIDGRKAAVTAMNTIGEVMQGDIQKKIVDGPFTPNAPATVKQKGSARPLIDSGRMRQSVRYAIRKRGSGKK